MNEQIGLHVNIYIYIYTFLDYIYIYISMYIPFKLQQPLPQVGDRLGEAKMLMALGESTTVTEGRAKAGR